MALPASGAISMNNVNVELGCTATSQRALNDTVVRTLFGVPSGQISMSNGWGKSNFVIPTTLGTCNSTWGGYYMGVLCGYYMFVAPNATGCACCQWKTTNDATGSSSLTDGYNNTYTYLANASHPAGNFTATRTIAGFSNWYLPAIDELQQIYNNGGTDGRGILPAGESYAAATYWSSFEYSADGALYLYFFSGLRINNIKTALGRTRAVRRVPI